MPYIPKDHRAVYDRHIYDIMYNMENLFSYKKGHLNYIVSQMCNVILQRKGLSYATMSDLVAELECAKLELYSKVAAPYEDEKAQENGEVYGEDLRIPERGDVKLLP